MTWGYALVWAQQFLTRDQDPWLAKLKFLKEYGLQTTGISLKDWAEMEPSHRDRIACYLADNDLALTLGIHADWYAVDAPCQVEQQLRRLEQFGKLARSPICTTSGGGRHRFLNDPPLAQQLETITCSLRPLAQICHQMGIPLGIENHGNYYISDLIQVCEAVPNLGIFLDTGNTYLVGEQPLRAFKEAAPYTVGCHFKDQTVAPRPDGKPLNFEVDVAITGQGHVPLKECYALLRSDCPNFENLAMQIELIPPSFQGNDPIEAFEQALAFVRGLEEVAA